MLFSESNGLSRPSEAPLGPVVVAGHCIVALMRLQAGRIVFEEQLLVRGARQTQPNPSQADVRHAMAEYQRRLAPVKQLEELLVG